MAGRSVDILINAKDNASAATTRAGAAFKSLTTTLGGLRGMLLGGIGGMTIAAGFKAIVGSFNEAEVATAKLDAVLKATGNASGFSLKQMRDYAGELQGLVAIDDDIIASNMGVLASFTRIKGEAFKGAMKAALDLSAVMEQDLQSSVVQIGKALNDPIKGLTALSRVGVSFTASQKAMIKEMVAMNDIAGAQKIILAELNTEFGGAAAAKAGTLEGKINKLSLAFDNLRTAIGGAMAPTLSGWLEKAADAVNEQVAGNPAIQNRIDQFGQPAKLQFPDKSEMGGKFRALNAELTATMKVRDDLLAAQKTFMGFSWKNETKIGDAETAIKSILSEMKELNRAARDPAGKANLQISELFKGIEDGAPKALEAIKNFAIEGNQHLQKFEGQARANRFIQEFLGGLSVGGVIGAIGGVIGPMQQARINPGDVFGSSPFTEGGRLVNQGFENRGLHKAPFTDVPPTLKTLQALLAEEKGAKEWRDKMLRAVEKEPGVARQILEIRNQLN